MKIPEKCQLLQTSAWVQSMFFSIICYFTSSGLDFSVLFLNRVNPLYKGQNIEVYNHKFLWMVMHYKGFVVRKLLYIKKKPNIKMFTQSHCVFLCFLNELAKYLTPYFCEYLITQ